MHILLVDDQQLLCKALAELLERKASEFHDDPVRVTPVFTLDSAIQALKPSESDVPPLDLVFLDLNLDDDNKGIITLERFQSHNTARVPIVIFTGLMLNDRGAVETLKKCVTHGVRGMMLKGADLDKAFVGLKRLFSNEEWIQPDLLPILINTPSLIEQGLTKAERRVADGIARGLLYKTIAYELEITEGTARQTGSAIFRKLGFRNRTEFLLSRNTR